MPKNFLVYKSAAGSGKTYTLVKEYLKLVLLDPSRYRHILAITFTNAAAAEMKERIIGALGAISQAQDPGDDDGRKLIAHLTKDYQEDASEDTRRIIPTEEHLIANAGRVLKLVLHHYTDFAVSTIDSFVHRVIRSFAFDLHIPHNVEVELDTDSLLKKAVDLLIKQAGQDETLTRLLISFILSQADQEEDTRIENRITQLAFNLVDEDSAPYVEKLKDIPLEDFGQTAGNLRQSVQSFERRIQQEGQAALDLIRGQGLTAQAFYQGNRGIVAYFQHMAAGRVREKIEPGKTAAKTINEDKWFAGKATDEEKTAIERIKDQLIGHFEAIQQIASRELETYRCAHALLATIYPLALLSEVERMVEEIKTEEVTLHISDFNKRISAIIAEQPVPFIYERLGERYQHYMIDEFQDTSLLQWQNLLPLVSNALAGGHKSLVVGDGKQAIYRFRNGDVEQFANLPRLTEGIRSVSKSEWEVALANNFEQVPLPYNWRSARSVVHFNNAFFSFAKNLLHEDLQSIYGKVEQKERPNKPEGYVSVRFLDGTDRQDYEQAQLAAVLDAINTCREAGHALSDITVLCRAHREGSLVAQELLKHHIPVISEESLLLSHSDEVNVFLATLRLLANPEDAIAAVEMITLLHRSGALGTSLELHECLHMAGLTGKQHNGPGESTPMDGVEKVLHHLDIPFSFKDFTHLNIYDTCETLVRIFFSTQTPPDPFVAFFMDAIFEFTHRHALTYDDFLEWWEEKGKNHSIVVPEGVEAVQVMTIHKSKGLQFPVVIHPFADKKPNRLTRSGLWTDERRSGIQDPPVQYLRMTKKDLGGTGFEQDLAWEQAKTFLDMLNATYVAFTRPVEKLFIIAKQPEKKHDPLSVHGMLHDFFSQESAAPTAENTFTRGRFEQPSRKSQDQQKQAEQPFRHMLSGLWSRNLRMRSHQKERSILFDKEDPMQRGNLLHRAMEEIHHPDDIAPVIDRMQANGEISGQQAARWKDNISRLLNDPVLAPCFAKGARVKTEAGLMDQDGRFYRPDRVVFLEKETAIIDYKSGKAHASHQQQMEAYAAILQQMGYPAVKKLIVYLDEGTTKTV